MRYIDSGSRAPDQALGFWLQQELAETQGVAALRWQSGYFGAGVLGIFAPAFSALRRHGGALRLLVGSNDGATRRADLAKLLEVVGPPRDNQQIAVVAFDNGFFHSKTVHISRTDGSAVAYVGSANLSESGVAALHVEAGVLLDSSAGDDLAVLGAVAEAVDRWFTSSPSGSYVVSDELDLDDLVARGILDVPKPPPHRRPGSTTEDAPNTGARLSPLISLPPVPVGPLPELTSAGTEAAATRPILPTSPVAGGRSLLQADTRTASWQKTLTQSDAQRKPTGNQRGSITLVGGSPQVDSQRYFRFDLSATLPGAKR